MRTQLDIIQKIINLTQERTELTHKLELPSDGSIESENQRKTIYNKIICCTNKIDALMWLFE